MDENYRESLERENKNRKLLCRQNVQCLLRLKNTEFFSRYLDKNVFLEFRSIP